MTRFFLRFVIIVLMTLLLSNNYLSAQTRKVVFSISSAFTGDFFTETYSVNSNNLSQSKTSKFNFQPAISYFFSDLFKAGIYMDYDFLQEKGDNNNYNRTKSSSFGPFLRINMSENNVSPFIHTEFGYSGLKFEQHDDTNDSEADFTGINYGVGLGIEFFIQRKCSFEVLLNYRRSKLSFVQKGYNFYGPVSDKIDFEQKGVEIRFGFNVFIK
jgi:hypothetical protein